jgi:hypothetical protein
VLFKIIKKKGGNKGRLIWLLFKWHMTTRTCTCVCMCTWGGDYSSMRIDGGDGV